MKNSILLNCFFIIIINVLDKCVCVCVFVIILCLVLALEIFLKIWIKQKKVCQTTIIFEITLCVCVYRLSIIQINPIKFCCFFCPKISHNLWSTTAIKSILQTDIILRVRSNFKWLKKTKFPKIFWSNKQTNEKKTENQIFKTSIHRQS